MIGPLLRCERHTARVVAATQGFDVGFRVLFARKCRARIACLAHGCLVFFYERDLLAVHSMLPHCALHN